MKPSKTLARTLSTLLAADTTYLANATAMKVGLIVAPFTESIDRAMADLTISTDTGLTAIAATAGAQNESIDPLNGKLIVEIKPPAGGFRWETPDPFTTPVTVHGLALGNGAMNVLYGTHTFAEPITLTEPNQAFTAPPLTFEIDPNKVY